MKKTDIEKTHIFSGIATAIITPFKEGKIDYTSFEKLILRQINGGIDALVISGTTGEAPVLDDSEHYEMIKFAIDCSEHKIPIIAGCGSNDTSHTIKLAQNASKVGCDGLLIVTPYYNKTNPEGLVKTFSEIENNTNSPIIIYNVPSRTGMSVPVEVYIELSHHKQIVAVKESSGNTTESLKILSHAPNLDIYTGNDENILPMLSIGARGSISVISNLLPTEIHNLWEHFQTGEIAKSRDLQTKLYPLISLLFSEVNPIPVKTALAKMGLCEEEFRLPLYNMNKAKKALLFREMKKFSLI